MRRRGCNGERASGFPLPRLCGDKRNFISFVLHAHILRTALSGVCQNRNYRSGCGGRGRAAPRGEGVAGATFFADAQSFLAWRLPTVPCSGASGRARAASNLVCAGGAKGSECGEARNRSPPERKRFLKRFGRGTGRRRAAAFGWNAESGRAPGVMAARPFCRSTTRMFDSLAGLRVTVIDEDQRTMQKRRSGTRRPDEWR